MAIFKYTKKDVEDALKAMADGMSCGEAARVFKVPKTTLLYKHKHSGKYLVARRMGPDTVLCTSEEKMLCQWIVHMENSELHS